MIDKRRLTQAALSVGMAGGLLSGVTLGLFTMGIKEHNRPDIVHALTAAIPGPPQLAHAASAIPPDEDSRPVGRGAVFSEPAGDLLERLKRDAGQDRGCGDRSRSCYGGEQPGPQKAKSSHRQLLSRSR